MNDTKSESHFECIYNKDEEKNQCRCSLFRYLRWINIWCWCFFFLWVRMILLLWTLVFFFSSSKFIDKDYEWWEELIWIDVYFALMNMSEALNDRIVWCDAACYVSDVIRKVRWGYVQSAHSIAALVIRLLIFSKVTAKPLNSVTLLSSKMFRQFPICFILIAAKL